MPPTIPLIADAFELDTLRRELAGTPFAGKVRHFPTIDSTNTLAMREAEQGQESGTVYLADEQTVGRGRGAHEWHSAAGSGLYVSILLRPAIAPADILWLSLAAGLAVQAAVRDVTSLAPDIRWPNDLLLSGRKMGGILTELNAEVTRVRHAVIGIGLNVHQPSFPAELAPLATGLAVQAAVRDVTSLAPDIRWPNDLLLSGRKMGGILTELNAEVARVRHAVIGIGLNVHQPSFPTELAALATSLKLETGRNGRARSCW